jgi:predicted translin family RNA/ssDNA-binding protein
MKPTPSYFEETYFTKLKEQYDATDANREKIITTSREIEKDAKKAIYMLHRNDTKGAEELIIKAKQNILAATGLLVESESLDSVGALTKATEEYVEAVCFRSFLQNKPIPTAEQLDVSNEVYLGGLSDLTGELVRAAVHMAIDDSYETLIPIRDLIDELYGYLLAFNFRNSNLRKKFDAIKYNLKKMEDLLLELKLKGKIE